MIVERLSAKQYYKHKWAVGQVVLVNGQCVFHGKWRDAIKFEKELKHDRKTNV